MAQRQAPPKTYEAKKARRKPKHRETQRTWRFLLIEVPKGKLQG